MSALAKKLGISRRTLLGGSLAGATVAIGLPALDLFLNESGTAYAGGMGFPTRFGIFFFGNGVIPRLWNPALGRSLGTDTYVVGGVGPAGAAGTRQRGERRCRVIGGLSASVL